MPETIIINREKEIVEIIATGVVTIDHMNVSRQQVVETFHVHPIKGLLYDGRAISQGPSQEDLFDFSIEATKSSDCDGIRFAVLTNEKSDLHYMSLAIPARNNHREVKVFTEREEAISWLKENNR